MAMRRPPVDPRFRRRWAEARREEGRRRLRALLTAAVACLVVGAGVGLLHTSLFKVRHVQVVGNAHTSSTQVLQAAGLSRVGRTTLMVDAGSAAAVRQVDALPWVARASFTRQWPWTVTISVVERVPAAVVQGAPAMAAGGLTPAGQVAALEVVDKTGRVLEVLGQGEHVPSLPVVSGLRSAAPGYHVLPGPGITRGEMSQLLQAAAAAPSELAKSGLNLSLRAPGSLTALMGGTKALIVLGNSGQIGEKWAVLEELSSRVGLSGYRLVDLTVPQRPALTPLMN